MLLFELFLKVLDEEHVERVAAHGFVPLHRNYLELPVLFLHLTTGKRAVSHERGTRGRVSDVHKNDPLWLWKLLVDSPLKRGARQIALHRQHVQPSDLRRIPQRPSLRLRRKRRHRDHRITNLPSSRRLPDRHRVLQRHPHQLLRRVALLPQHRSHRTISRTIAFDFIRQLRIRLHRAHAFVARARAERVSRSRRHIRRRSRHQIVRRLPDRAFIVKKRHRGGRFTLRDLVQGDGDRRSAGCDERGFEKFTAEIDAHDGAVCARAQRAQRAQRDGERRENFRTHRGAAGARCATRSDAPVEDDLTARGVASCVLPAAGSSVGNFADARAVASPATADGGTKVFKSLVTSDGAVKGARRRCAGERCRRI